MKTPLLDYVEIIGGGTPNTKNPLYWNGEIGWLSVEDFKNVNAYVFNSAKTITKLGFENILYIINYQKFNLWELLL